MASVATLVQPTGEMWKKIRVELNEDVNTRDRDLTAIKDWLRKQPHLPDEWGVGLNVKLPPVRKVDSTEKNRQETQQFFFSTNLITEYADEGRMMTFLRGCSFSLEKCKRKLDMYFTMRAACPEFFTNRDINRRELADITRKAQGAPLPGLTPDGRRVTVCRGLDKNIDPELLNNIFKIALMIGDVRLIEELEGVGGDIYILDASVVTPSHLAKISPSSIKKFLICVQEAYPIKLKQVHVLNTSPVIEALINFIKPFLKDKIKNRIFVHSDISTLHEHVPKDMLPEQYGGNGCSLDEVNDAWMKKLEDYTEWFKKQESIKANEALRPGKPTNYDELFGIDGSFRQLSID